MSVAPKMNQKVIHSLSLLNMYQVAGDGFVKFIVNSPSDGFSVASSHTSPIPSSSEPSCGS